MTNKEYNDSLAKENRTRYTVEVRYPDGRKESYRELLWSPALNDSGILSIPGATYPKYINTRYVESWQVSLQLPVDNPE